MSQSSTCYRKYKRGKVKPICVKLQCTSVLSSNPDLAWAGSPHVVSRDLSPGVCPPCCRPVRLT